MFLGLRTHLEISCLSWWRSTTLGTPRKLPVSPFDMSSILNQNKPLLTILILMMDNVTVLHNEIHFRFYNRYATGAAQRRRFKTVFRAHTVGRTGEPRPEDPQGVCNHAVITVVTLLLLFCVFSYSAIQINTSVIIG